MSRIRAFFADLWAKIKSDVINAFALISTFLGSILAHIDALAATLGDPNLTSQISTVVSDAKLIGKWLLFVGIVTAVAKFKQLLQSPPKG